MLSLTRLTEKRSPKRKWDLISIPRFPYFLSFLSCGILELGNSVTPSDTMLKLHKQTYPEM